MKVIYLTDIHDDLKELRFIIKNTEASLYIISGDIIYKAFYTEDKLYDFIGQQEYFYKKIKNENLNLTPFELATEVVNSPNKFTDTELEYGENYLDLFEQAVINMREKYMVINDLVDKYAQAKTFFIPGNYDMNLDYTGLKDFNLHKKTLDFKGIRFSGYGGAPVATLGIPEQLAVHYNEDKSQPVKKSEVYNFYMHEKPDVVVTHNPAYGTFDKLPGYGNVGSFGLREYIDKLSPALVLSGHMHEDYGLMKIQNSLCLNPSNFGRVISLLENDLGGYYCSFELSKKNNTCNVDNFELLNLNEKKINKILAIKKNLDGKLEEKIFDENEFMILGRFLR